MARITKTTVDAAKPQQRDSYLWDSELPGFGLKVTPAGRKVFLIQYRVGGSKGRTRRVTLGNLGPITPDEARRQAKVLLGQVKAGTDPAAEHDRQRAELTLGQAIDRFVAQHVEHKTKAATAESYKRALAQQVPQSLRRRPLGSIVTADIDRLHHDLGSTPAAANRLVAVLSKLFSWCERQQLRPQGTNPCRHVERYDEIARERFLSEQELARLGAALAADPRPYVVAAIKLLIFTGARLNEILSARWEWVDLGRGVIRLPDSKTGAKNIQLNAPSLEVLAVLPRVDGNPFVIVGEKDGAHLVNLQKPWRAIRKAANLADVRLHDLRHTFASVGVAGGASLPIVGALLGHSQPQTTDRYSHLSVDPLRQASDAIANRIAAGLKPAADKNNVVALPGGSRTS